MNCLIMLIGYAWPPGWWPMYGADAQHTRVQLLTGRMTSTPTVTKITLLGGTECEGPAIATIGGFSYIFLTHDDATSGFDDALSAVKYTGTYEFRYLCEANIPTQGFACAIYDIDGDGHPELFQGDEYTSTEWFGTMYCWTYRNDSLIHRWSYPFDSAYPRSPTIYDVDNDGAAETFFSDTRLDFIYCINANGTLRWEAVAKDMKYAPAVGQVIPGGDPEVIGTSGDTLMMWNARTGSRLATKYLGSVTISSAPAIADADRNDTMEVFIYTNNLLWCLKPSGNTFLTRWTQPVPVGGNTQKQGMGIADLNGDGWIDVAIGSGGSDDRVYCFRGYDGYPNWTSAQLAGDVHRGVAIADIDGDNQWEVIAQTIPGVVYCIAGESGFIQWSVDANASDMHDVSIGDVDGDGCSEIIAAGDSKGLWIIDDGSATNCNAPEISELDPGLAPLRAWFSGGVLYITSFQSGDASVRIYDPVGRTVISREISLARGENAIRLELRTGVYVGIIRRGDETVRIKFVVR